MVKHVMILSEYVKPQRGPRANNIATNFVDIFTIVSTHFVAILANIATKERKMSYVAIGANIATKCLDTMMNVYLTVLNVQMTHFARMSKDLIFANAVMVLPEMAKTV